MLPTTSPFMTSWSRKFIATPLVQRASRASGDLPFHVTHRKPRLDARHLAVLELDRRVDVDRLRLAVERGDDVPVTFLDDAAAYLPRPRELLVVGVELLVQEHELPYARGRRERLVHRGDLALEEVVDL